MAKLNFIFDPTSPTFRPVASSAAKAQGSDANVDAKGTTTQLDAALDYARRGCVNAGDKMHRYAGVKMHQ